MALAASTAAALVRAMTLDGWAVVRGRLILRLGRGDPGLSQQVALELDAAHHAVRSGSADLRFVQGRLQQWSAPFLSADPGAAHEITVLVAQAERSRSASRSKAGVWIAVSAAVAVVLIVACVLAVAQLRKVVSPDPRYSIGDCMTIADQEVDRWGKQHVPAGKVACDGNATGDGVYMVTYTVSNPDALSAGIYCNLVGSHPQKDIEIAVREDDTNTLYCAAD
ncbi:hypothetical protein ABZS66_60345 [Dactylosporangium sp. NPDC005572]|uniref:hypothetical protein n=1 Tax=Dactylosporangium sp. NPDC005572 TaxID=3156889 RepID=UPI00339FB562